MQMQKPKTNIKLSNIDTALLFDMLRANPVEHETDFLILKYLAERERNHMKTHIEMTLFAVRRSFGNPSLSYSLDLDYPRERLEKLKEKGLVVMIDKIGVCEITRKGMEIVGALSVINPVIIPPACRPTNPF